MDIHLDYKQHQWNVSTYYNFLSDQPSSYLVYLRTFSGKTNYHTEKRSAERTSEERQRANETDECLRVTGELSTLNETEYDRVFEPGRNGRDPIEREGSLDSA